MIWRVINLKFYDSTASYCLCDCKLWSSGRTVRLLGIPAAKPPLEFEPGYRWGMRRGLRSVIWRLMQYWKRAQLSGHKKKLVDGMRQIVMTRARRHRNSGQFYMHLPQPRACCIFVSSLWGFSMGSFGTYFDNFRLPRTATWLWLIGHAAHTKCQTIIWSYIAICESWIDWFLPDPSFLSLSISPSHICGQPRR